MDGKERRSILLERLKKADQPITGAMLSQVLGVSRQVIVGDIAILRAAGVDIYATPQGYMLPVVTTAARHTAKIACCHSKNDLDKELNIIVDNGGKVLDVILEHPVYGEIKANLMLASRREVAGFLSKLASSGAKPLSVVTSGVHLHTIEVPSPAILCHIEEELAAQGILLR